MIYKLMLFIIVLIFSTLYEYANRKEYNKSKFLMILLVLILSTFFALREYLLENYGTDYYTYKQWFESVSFNKIFMLDTKDFGFNTFIAIIKRFSANYIFFQFICGLVINSCIIKYIKQNVSKNFTLSLMIYLTFFYVSTFNVTRQWIACAIFLSGYSHIKNKKLIKYIITCLIAATFHASSVFLLVLYPILRENEKVFKKELIVAILGIIAFLNSSFLIKYILSSTNQYSTYLTYSKEIGNFTYAIICFLILAVLNIFSKITLELEENRRTTIFLAIAFIFSVLSTKSIIFNRFNIYLLPSIILALPIVIDIFKYKDKIVSKVFIYLLLLVIYL